MVGVVRKDIERPRGVLNFLFDRVLRLARVEDDRQRGNQLGELAQILAASLVEFGEHPVHTRVPVGCRDPQR